MSLVRNHQNNVDSVIDFSIYNITCEKCDKTMLNTQYSEHILNCPAIEIPNKNKPPIDIIKNSYDYDKLISNLSIDKSLSSLHRSSSNIYSNNGHTLARIGKYDKLNYDDDNDNDNDNDDIINDDSSKFIDPIWVAWIFRNNRNIYNYIFNENNIDNIIDNSENIENIENIIGNNIATDNSEVVDVELLTVSKDIIDCPVCLEKTTNNCELICRHLLCYECAKNWFKLKNNCPLCRQIVG